MTNEREEREKRYRCAGVWGIKFPGAKRRGFLREKPLGATALAIHGFAVNCSSSSPQCGSRPRSDIFWLFPIKGGVPGNPPGRGRLVPRHCQEKGEDLLNLAPSLMYPVEAVVLKYGLIIPQDIYPEGFICVTVVFLSRNSTQGKMRVGEENYGERSPLPRDDDPENHVG